MGHRLYKCLAAALVALLAAVLAPAGLLSQLFAEKWQQTCPQAALPSLDDAEGDDFSLLQSSALSGHVLLEDAASQALKRGNDKAAPSSLPSHSAQPHAYAALVSLSNLAVAASIASHIEARSSRGLMIWTVSALMLSVVCLTYCISRAAPDCRSPNMLAHQDFTKSPQTLQGALRQPPTPVHGMNQPPQGGIPQLSTPQQPDIALKHVPQQPQVRSPGVPEVQNPILALGQNLVASQQSAASLGKISTFPRMPPIAHSSDGRGESQQVEFRFAVSVSELRRCEAQDGRELVIDITSLSGAPQLQMVIIGRTRLDIRSPQHSVSIQIPTSKAAPFTIHDRDGRQYGQFQTKSAQLGLTEIVLGGTDVLMVQRYSTKLSFSVTIPGGKPIALARINSQDFRGDHFEVRVLPQYGSDPVLVLAVLLALAVTMES